MDVPATGADLKFSGAIQANLLQVRPWECGPQNAGAVDFYRASFLFQVQQTWYTMEVLSQTRLQGSVRTSVFGYEGPGTYTASIRLRELLVGPGGIGVISEGHAWITGYRHESAVTISAAPTQVSVKAWDLPPGGFDYGVFSDSTELWPSGGYAEPPESPVPGPNELVLVSGSWSCP